MFGLIKPNSLSFDEKTGLIYSPIDAVLIQNVVNITIVIEATNEISIIDGFEKFKKKCIKKNPAVNLTEEINKFTETRLTQRIKAGLKRLKLPFGEVATKTSKRRTLDPEETGSNLSGDDPEAAIQIITESDSRVEFSPKEKYQAIDLCFGRNLTNPKLDIDVVTKERLAHDDQQTKMFSNGFLIKEQDVNKFMNIDIGKYLNDSKLI